MEKKNIICIVCPTGCRIEATLSDGKVTDITGNTCKRGEEYAVNECTNPTRTLTSIVRVAGGKQPMLPVKSEKPLPRGLIFECMKLINKCSLHAPVKIGDIIIENILDTGINIVATSNTPNC